MNNNNNMTIQQEQNQMMIIDGLKLDRVTESMKKINQFQEVIQNTLVKDHDYGQAFFGSTKPSLLKPGAEKILMLMGLASKYEIIEKIQDYEEGFFSYTIRCILTRGGQAITEGLGHCNSKEKKYESDRQDKYMLGNTCLKMAKKRAQVDAALTVGSLSNMFTQDLEDMAQFNQSEQVENMTIEDARNMEVKFGKYGVDGGTTLGAIYDEDKGYTKWLADNAREPIMKQAAKMLLNSINEKVQTKSNGNNETSNKDKNEQEQLPLDEANEDIPF